MTGPATDKPRCPGCNTTFLLVLQNGCRRCRHCKRTLRLDELVKPGSKRSVGSGVTPKYTYRGLLAREEMQVSNIDLGEAKLSAYRQFHRKST